MALIERGQYPNMSRIHETMEERVLRQELEASASERRYDGRISVEPTGLPSGGYFVSVDGQPLHSKQGFRHRRIFQSEYRARKAGRGELWQREIDAEAMRLAQRRSA